MRLPADNPIRSEDDDLLGRADLARSFAEQVLVLDVSEGAVVGVLGPWGYGKTSFVNLARAHLQAADIPVLEFNPWMFSGAEQLVGSFFVELSAQLKLRPDLADIGARLQEYGESFSGLGWLPAVGPWIERGRGLGRLVTAMLQRRREGTGQRRDRLQAALVEQTHPIVVVLDDIDRLTTTEIRDVFKLIRLTANFPNIIYLVAFDRTRVESALSEQNIPGRQYLEKILQLGVDLPAIPEHVLTRQLLDAVDRSLADIENPGPFDQGAWPDVLHEIIRPLVKNMRDVRRYVAALHGTVRHLQGRVALVDVLALEAVRVFLPDVFLVLNSSVEALTTTSGITYGGRGDPPHLKEQVDRLLSTDPGREQVVHDLVGRLFFAASRHMPGGSHYGGEWKKTWLKERRVAHEDLLRLYLEGVAGEGLQAFTDAELAWARLADRDALDGFFRSLDDDRIQDVISALEVYEDDFRAEHVVPGVIVLLNLMPDLPERQRGMFDLDTRMVVSRVAYRLLRALPDEAAVEAVVPQILLELRSLSAKLELIGDVGHREGRGHKLTSEAFATDLEKAWRAEVRSASVDELKAESELLRTLLVTKREADAGEKALVIDRSPDLTLAVLQSARSDTRSQSLGSRAVHRSARLAWQAVVDIFGDEDAVRSRVEELRAADLPHADEVVELADKYLGGWNPDRFED